MEEESFFYLILFSLQAKYLYENGFNGGWSWCLGCDGNAQHDQDVAEGIEALKGRNDHGVIDITIE